MKYRIIVETTWRKPQKIENAFELKHHDIKNT